MNNERKNDIDNDENVYMLFKIWSKRKKKNTQKFEEYICYD